MAFINEQNLLLPQAGGSSDSHFSINEWQPLW